MAKKATKFYVVISGAKPGIYDNWEDCRRQIEGYPSAKYKSFASRREAEYAFKNGWESITGSSPKPRPSGFFPINGPILKSISVDAAWNTKTLDMEYQGVHTATGETIFRQGPFQDGTNNVGEFLAIVHALAYCKQNNLDLPIYSDSRNAIKWVKMKHHRSLLEPTERNKKIFNLLTRAEDWLKNNSYSNKILKWETAEWGENPADFGRK